jgi:hypothetical protein
MPWSPPLISATKATPWLNISTTWKTVFPEPDINYFFPCMRAAERTSRERLSYIFRSRLDADLTKSSRQLVDPVSFATGTSLDIAATAAFPAGYSYRQKPEVFEGPGLHRDRVETHLDQLDGNFTLAARA